MTSRKNIKKSDKQFYLHVFDYVYSESYCDICVSDYNNPFTPGSGLKPPYLAGRNSELDTFSHMLQRIKAGKVENKLLYGLRGVGKTVLLNRFAEICIDKKFLPISRSQYTTQHADPNIFVKCLQYDLDRAIKACSKTNKAKKRIMATARYLKPMKIEIPGLISYQPAYDLDAYAPLDNRIYDYLKNAWNVLEPKGIEGLVFLLDEFHVINDVKKKGWYTLADFIGAINLLQIEGYKFSLVLCGLPPMISNVKISRSYSERMFESMPISNLEDYDAKRAILEPLKSSHWNFSDELTSTLILDTDRYPYFIQFFCSEIIERAGGKQHIDLDYYRTVRSPILKKLEHSFFIQRMSALSTAQNSVLNSMASLPDNVVDFSSICTTTGMGKGTVYNHLKRLEEKELVHKSQRGTYQFSIPLFKKYLTGKL